MVEGKAAKDSPDGGPTSGEEGLTLPATVTGGSAAIAARLQQAILEKEGVEFDETGALDLDRYRYKPRRRKPPARKSGRKRVTRR